MYSTLLNALEVKHPQRSGDTGEYAQSSVVPKNRGAINTSYRLC